MKNKTIDTLENGLNNSTPLTNVDKRVFYINNKEDLRKFMDICFSRFSEEINAETPYLVFIINTLDVLGQMNHLFNINGMSSQQIYDHRISIQLSDDISQEDINRIRVLKENDYKEIHGDMRLLVNTIEDQIIPELSNFLHIEKVEKRLIQNIKNIETAVGNVELSWYYKNLLNWKVQLFSTIWFDHDKFNLYDEEIVRMMPVKSSTLVVNEPDLPKFKFPERKPSIRGLRKFISKLQPVQDFEEAIKVTEIFKFYNRVWIAKRQSNDFCKVLYWSMFDLLSFYTESFKNVIKKLAKKYGNYLIENVPNAESIVKRVVYCVGQINQLVDELNDVQPPHNVAVAEKIVCRLKQIDFALLDLYSILTKIKSNNNIVKGEQLESILNGIYVLKNNINAFLRFLEVYENYWTRNKARVISFNPKNNKLLYKKSIALKPEILEYPENINDRFKNVLFKLAGVKDKDTARLLHDFGLSYVCNRIPVFYNSLADSINLLKMHLINLDVILHSNVNLPINLQLNQYSLETVEKFFANHFNTASLLKTSLFKIIENLYIISTPAISVDKTDLLEFKMYVDECLNISNEFLSSKMFRKTIELNAGSLTEKQLAGSLEFIKVIETLVGFIKNLAIAMSVSINSIIKSVDLYSTIKEHKYLVESNEAIDILKIIPTIKTYKKIKVKYSSNIQSINKANWYEIDRTFDYRTKEIIDEEINNFYEAIDKTNSKFDPYENPDNTRKYFEQWWNVYLTEQGITKDLEKLSKRTDDLVNDEYLRFTFAKNRYDMINRNLTLEHNVQHYIEVMLNCKLAIFKLYAAKNRICKTIVEHRRKALWAFRKLTLVFGQNADLFDLLKTWINAWFSDANRLMEDVRQLTLTTNNPKIHYINHMVDVHRDLLSINEIEKINIYNELIPQAIFAGFAPKELRKFGLSNNVVPVDKYEKIYSQETNKLQEPENIREEFELLNLPEDVTTKVEEEIKVVYTDKIADESILWPNIKVENFVWDDIIQTQINNEETTEEVVEETESGYSLINEEQIIVDDNKEVSVLMNPNPVTINYLYFYEETPVVIEEEQVQEIIEEVAEEIIAEEIVEEIIDEVLEEADEINEVVLDEEEVQYNFENDEVLDEIAEKEIVEEINNDIIEYVYADPTPLTDEELLACAEIVEVEEPTEETVEEVVNTVVDENAPYADPIVEVYDEPVEEVVEEIPTYEDIIDEVEKFEEETPVVEETDDEINEDEIEYVYADSTPLTDEELLAQEEATEETPVEEVAEEVVNTVVDESAPYADPIVEVYDEPVEETESGYSLTNEEETPVEEETLVEESVEEQPEEITEEIEEPTVDEVVEESTEEETNEDEIEYVDADPTPLTDEELLAQEEATEETPVEEVAEEVVDTVVDENAPYADEIVEVEEQPEEINEETESGYSLTNEEETPVEEETLVEESVEEQPEEITEEIEEPTAEDIIDQEEQQVVETTPVEERKLLSKSFDLSLPVASDANLDWTEFDKNSHVEFIEEPVFVKVFKIKK